MKQYEAVIEVMRESGGYATLGHLYENALKVEGVIWKTKTPFASIRRIVQDPRFFFKIRPGLWALNEYRDRLPFPSKARTEQETQFSHSYYQGLLVEIGNLQHFSTFVPAQDKNRKFLTRSLSTLATLAEIPQFTFPEIVNRARTIDVAWFNSRHFPHSFFEVEHSTDIWKALVKFMELRDFNAEFAIVADQARHAEYDDKLRATAFADLRSRVRFINYDAVSEMHSRQYESYLAATRFQGEG